MGIAKCQKKIEPENWFTKLKLMHEKCGDKTLQNGLKRTQWCYNVVWMKLYQ